MPTGADFEREILRQLEQEADDRRRRENIYAVLNARPLRYSPTAMPLSPEETEELLRESSERAKILYGQQEAEQVRDEEEI